MKKVQIAGATLYCGDALFLIDQVEQFGALITDPPYSSGGAFRGDRSKSSSEKYLASKKVKENRPDIIGDNRDARSWQYWSILWLSRCCTRLPEGAPFIVFSDWRQLPATTDIAQAAGLVWRGLCPWVKTACRPMAGRFAHQSEYIVWGSKGGMPWDWNKKPLPGAFTCPSPAVQKRLHQTEKPLQLMLDLVKICEPGIAVFDPFMGTATTGVAALKSDLKFIGIEMHPLYFDLSCQRIEQAARELDKGA